MLEFVVLISSAGATNGVNVIDALRQSESSYRLVAIDCNPLAAGLYLADRKHIVPSVDDEQAFVNKLLKICQTEQVDIALPIYSADFPVFNRAVKKLQKMGVRTYTVPEESINICWNKLRVIHHLKKIGIPCPDSWSWEEALNKAPLLKYPLFMKRHRGSGSKETAVIQTRLDLEYWARPGYIFQEYIENAEEFTVDVISDLGGNMLTASPRKRIRVYGGLSVCGVTVHDDEIVEYTKRIVESLQLPGPSNVQCKRVDGTLKFYDVNPRFASGGLPLAVAAGVNMPDILIRLIMGRELPRDMKPKSGVYMIRHWGTSFVREKGKDYEIFN